MVMVAFMVAAFMAMGSDLAGDPAFIRIMATADTGPLTPTPAPPWSPQPTTARQRLRSGLTDFVTSRASFPSNPQQASTTRSSGGVIGSAHHNRGDGFGSGEDEPLAGAQVIRSA